MISFFLTYFFFTYLLQPGSPEDPTEQFHDRGQYIQFLAPSRTVFAYALVDEATEAAEAAAEKAKLAPVVEESKVAEKLIVEKPAAKTKTSK